MKNYKKILALIFVFVSLCFIGMQNSKLTSAQGEVGGIVHILKYVNGAAADANLTNNIEFPMYINTSSGNGPYVLRPSGWEGAEVAGPYEATTFFMDGGSVVTTNEIIDSTVSTDAKVGTSCDGTHQYSLRGYSTGATRAEAEVNGGNPSSTASVTVDGPQYIIVWNEKCTNYVPPVNNTVNINIYKYLDNGSGVISQIPDSMSGTIPTFTMSATTTGYGTGTYELGVGYGSAPYLFAARASGLTGPIDYTTSEITTSTDANSNVVPPDSSTCPEDKYQLIGYKYGDTLVDAESATISTTPPNYKGLNSDTYIIVVNKKCVTGPVEQLAHIIFVKIAQGGNGTFHFSGIGNSNGFDLTTSTATSNTASAAFDVTASTEGIPYTITELAPGWDLSNVQCVIADLLVNGDVDYDNKTVPLTVHTNDNITCTFINTKQETPTTDGNIIVDVVTDPQADDTNFHFSVNGSGYNSFDLSDQGSPNNQTLHPGNYAVSLDDTTGWSQTSATCITNTPANTVDPNAITLHSGETVNCTFVITKQNTPTTGHIIVDNQTSPAEDATSFHFTAIGSGYASFNLADQDAPNDQVLEAGTYGISVDALDGWLVTNASCTSNVTLGSFDSTAINLHAGETVTCVFINTKQIPPVTTGHIIIDNVTNPSSDETNFHFTTTGTGFASFNLTDTDMPNDQTLTAGIYGISIGNVDGWTQTVSCTDENNAQVNPTGINLIAGTTIHCTFTNTKKGHIIIHNLTNPVNDSTSFHFSTTGSGYNSFDLSGNDTANDQTLPVGSYGISVDSLNGWTKTSASCTSSTEATISDLNSINLHAGETINCTFLNTKNPVIHTCSDGMDNNNDGIKDDKDPRCYTDGDVNNSSTYNANGDTEITSTLAICRDGKDNDDDGLIDSKDPDCHEGGNVNNAWNKDKDSESAPNPTPVIIRKGGGGFPGAFATNLNGQVLGAFAINYNGQIVSTTNNTNTNVQTDANSPQVCTDAIYITKAIRKGAKNDSTIVKKIQQFLNVNMNAKLKVDGKFGVSSEKFLKKFQLAHKDRILTPWGFKTPTGIFSITTQTEVNNIICPNLKLPIPTTLSLRP